MPYSERQIRNILRRLATNWNNDYWIFVESGDTHLMRKLDGKPVYLTNNSVDMDYSVECFSKIQADGGAV